MNFNARLLNEAKQLEKLWTLGVAGILRVDAGRDRSGRDSRLVARARARIAGTVGGDARPDR